LSCAFKYLGFKKENDESKKNICWIIFAIFSKWLCTKYSFIGTSLYIGCNGNIYQAGLTYGSNQAITKITGKSPTENIKSFTDRKKSKIDEEQNYDEFIALVKNKIEKTSKIINLANQ